MENEVINSVGCIHKEYDEQKEIVLKGYYVSKNIIRKVECIIIIVFCVIFIAFLIGSSAIMIFNSDYFDSHFDILNSITQLFLIVMLALINPSNFVRTNTFMTNLISTENRKVFFEIGKEYLKMTKASFYLTGKRTSQETETGIINLKDDVCKVIRTPELYTIVLPNNSFNVIPLNIFTAQEVQQIDGMFLNALGKKFYRKKA